MKQDMFFRSSTRNTTQSPNKYVFLEDTPKPVWKNFCVRHRSWWSWSCVKLICLCVRFRLGVVPTYYPVNSWSSHSSSCEESLFPWLHTHIVNESVTDKIRKYRSGYYNNPPNTTSFVTVITSTSGRLRSEFVWLLFLQDHLIHHRKLTVFFKFQEFSLCILPVDSSTSTTQCSPLTLGNFPSINLVFIFRCSSSPRNPVYPRRVDSSVLVFSLSSHRHSFIGLVSLLCPFIVNQKRLGNNPVPTESFKTFSDVGRNTNVHKLILQVPHRSRSRGDRDIWWHNSDPRYWFITMNNFVSDFILISNTGVLQVHVGFE